MPEADAVTTQLGAETVASVAQCSLALFEHLRDGAAFHQLVCDASGRPIDYRILDVNHQYEQHVGLRRSEIAGRLASEVYKTAPFLEEFSAVGLGGAARQLECYSVSLQRHFAISVVPLGKPTFAVIFSDITQRKREVDELRRNQTALRALLDNLPFLAWLKDNEGRYLAVNRAFAERCGQPSVEAILGKTSREVWTTKIPIGYLEDDVTPASPHSQRVIEFRPSDGAETRYLEICSSPVQSEDGTTIGLAGMARDITENRRAEEARLESERKFMQVFDLAPDPISVTLPEGDFLYANRAFCDFTGYTFQELLAGSVTQLGIWQSPEKRAEAVALLMQHGRFERLEVKLRGRNGKTYCMECSAVVSELEGRRVLIQALRDVTEQRLAEERARVASDTLAQYFELIPDPICIADQNAVFLSLNPAWEQVLGHSIEHLKGSAYLNYIHPDDLAPTREAIRRLDAGQPVIDFRNRYRHANGNWRWLEWRSIQDVQGKVYGVARDVTERIREEEALRAAERAASKSREQLLRVSELAQIGHFVIETETGQTSWTPELYRILGRDTDTLPTVSAIREAVSGADLALFDQAMSRANQTGSPQRLRLRVVRPSGEHRHCLTIIERDSTESGNCRLLGLVQDLTELQRSEEERRKLELQVMLAQKLESLGVLAGGIAHDFNNLLTSILGNIELALCELPPDHPACSYLDDVDTVGRRAADLCRQMLAYSGKGRFVVQSLAINDLVREMGHLLSVSISKKSSLVYRLAPHLPSIVADVSQIRQVVMNLITNASEAISHENGTITLSTGVVDCDAAYFKNVVGDNSEHAPGRYVYLEVQDDGCGMDPETLGKIFDPFFSTKFTGRGLGLAAVLGIVRGHRGALLVQSTQGDGSAFRVLIPAFEAPAASLDTAKSDPEKWTGSGVVLLVDDEASVRNMTRNLLQRAGFEVLCAADGLEAIELYQSNSDRIRLVILDMTMPKMDGETCFRELQQIAPNVQVILTSGYDEQSVVEGFIHRGLAGFVQKPYKASDLLSKIRHVLENAARSTRS